MKEEHISRLGKCVKCDDFVRIRQVIDNRVMVICETLNEDGTLHECQQQVIRDEYGNIIVTADDCK